MVTEYVRLNMSGYVKPTGLLRKQVINISSSIAKLDATYDI